MKDLKKITNKTNNESIGAPAKLKSLQYNQKKIFADTSDQEYMKKIFGFCEDYKTFLDNGKTERMCAKWAKSFLESKGFKEYKNTKLVPGEKYYYIYRNKVTVAFRAGKENLEKGVNILASHVDSPRLDLKPHPLYEDSDICLLKTHYYGGIKKYQWTAIPLMLTGVVIRKDGSCIDVQIGDKPEDPVLYISDILPHLAADQMKRNLREGIKGEELNVLAGTIPFKKQTGSEIGDCGYRAGSETGGCGCSTGSEIGGCGCSTGSESGNSRYRAGGETKANEKNNLCDGGQKVQTRYDAGSETASEPVKNTNETIKNPVKENVLRLLNEKYDIDEEDFFTAELTLVPAYTARDSGFDRSMIAAYGHDDKVCAYTSIRALTDAPDPEKTSLCIWADKEEIGSMGMTGMQSDFLINFLKRLADINNASAYEMLDNSACLSADVDGAYDPTFADAYELRNSSELGGGVVICKYTGDGGKYDASDANAEFAGKIRNIFNNAGVIWQMSDLGRIDLGGGGTVSQFVANRGIDTLDCGVPVISMHAPYELVSKADVYMAYRAYKAFLEYGNSEKISIAKCDRNSDGSGYGKCSKTSFGNDCGYGDRTATETDNRTENGNETAAETGKGTEFGRCNNAFAVNDTKDNGIDEKFSESTYLDPAYNCISKNNDGKYETILDEIKIEAESVQELLLKACGYFAQKNVSVLGLMVENDEFADEKGYYFSIDERVEDDPINAEANDDIEADSDIGADSDIEANRNIEANSTVEVDSDIEANSNECKENDLIPETGILLRKDISESDAQKLLYDMKEFYGI